MHKVSRSLLSAGVVALGMLAAACGSDTVITPITTTTTPTTPTGITNITVSPPSATIAAGTSITLAASVSADASTAKTVTWTSSNATVATVDATGKVTGVAAGTVTITATATADASKASAAFITVTAGPIIAAPTISIASVTDLATNNPVNLSNVNGQINITVNTSGGGLVEVFLSTSCSTNTISATDVAAGSQVTSSAQAGQVTLSINTAALTAANAPRFANGNYCIKSRLTSGTTQVVATNTTALTLNNTNQFQATTNFVSKTTKADGTAGPVSAISSLNGLNYNQGELTVTFKPVIFTTSTPIAFISGYLTRNGEQLGGASPGNATFVNTAVSSAGAATIVFTDTATINATGTGFVGGAPARSIAGYTSLPAGDTLYITSATDNAGNPITVTPTPGFPAFAVLGGLRIDNDPPTLPGSTVVTAPNGYISAAYVFSSGTTGASASDVKAGIAGVGGVTTTYYVGATSAAGFTSGVNTCSTSGLIAASTGNDLPNTTAINTNAAKVITIDALGNKLCRDVASTYAGGLFGVDKIAPLAAFTTSTVAGNSAAADQTGYTSTLIGFNTTFSDSISGFQQNPGSSPYVGRLVRNDFVAPSAANCVIGTYNAAAGTCAAIAINTGNTPSFTEVTSPFSASVSSTFQFTNGTNVPGYYTVTLTPQDVAGNVGTTLTRKSAFDNVPPTAAAPTQSAAAVPTGSVTVNSSATDNLDLISSRGNLIYNPASGAITFARVSGNTLGAFGQFVTSATASVVLPNVYRGLQDGSTGTIAAGAVLPTATVTVTDVGGNSTTSAASGITTTTASTDIFVGNTVSLRSSAANGAVGASVATTNLTFQIGGVSTDPNFQSQPFAQVDIYKLNSAGEYALVTSLTAAAVTDNTTTGARTFTYIASGVALSPGTATNTFIAIGRNAAGNAVLSPSVTQTNP